MTTRVVGRARELNNFVRIDMEDSTCTTDTLRIYRELRRDFSNVGVVVQAYLRRTAGGVFVGQKLWADKTLCERVYGETFENLYYDMWGDHTKTPPVVRQTHSS